MSTQSWVYPFSEIFPTLNLIDNRLKSPRNFKYKRNCVFSLKTCFELKIKRNISDKKAYGCFSVKDLFLVKRIITVRVRVLLQITKPKYYSPMQIYPSKSASDRYEMKLNNKDQ